ncbi:MAG TPA: GNAT family N-acetyltransferase [Rhizomicrobium sp.]|nr:GNAT family N-acetyltransferase [Rhizomicrobium sp.]
MATTIRLATAADANETAEVFIASQESMRFLPKLHTREETRALIAGLIGRAEVWVAERNGEIVGMACMDGEWLAHLYVHPSRHNTKTGSALLNQVKAAKPDGFQLWTFQANLGARRFYERHGCALVRVTNGEGNEEKLPDALYVWPATRPEV